MIKGLAPIKRKDHRTYDFHATFGTAATTPTEFNFDTSGVMPDQNVDGLPNACTAYTINDAASNEDKCGYYDDQAFTYNNTKLMAGLEGDVPVDIMTALKSATVYGVKRKDQTPADALSNRRSPYFIVKKDGDYFGGLISAMWVKQGGLIIGTPWLSAFEAITSNGLIPPFFKPASFTSGHCWEAVGVKIINSEQHIICKSWQGKYYGERGYCYFNRQQINDLLSVRGAGAFGQKHASPEDIKAVKMTVIETLISYLYMLIAKMGSYMKPKLGTTECPVINHPPLLDAFCAAIRDYEGSPGDLNYRNNNPGNCRYSSVGYDPRYGIVKKDKQNFAIFKDYQTGWLYLQNLVRSKIQKNPNQTITQFMQIYAPSADNNNPETYAKYIAKRLGVDINTFRVKELLS